jgi:CheY-like chemotaxis protein
MTPMSSRKESRDLTVLIVGGKPHAVQTLRTVLTALGIRHLTAVPDGLAAIAHFEHQQPSVIFCDETTPRIEGAEFASAARRAPGVGNPMVPIFLVCAAPRRKDVVVARDVGVTDVIVRPYSAATIERKLRVALDSPRAFIKAGTFFGPDRRVDHRPPYKGEDRRSRTPRKVRVAIGNPEHA